MPATFFSLFRLAGLNVGFLIVALLILGVLAVVAWKPLRVVLVTVLLLALLPLGVLARAMGWVREPATEKERVAQERVKHRAKQFIANQLRLSDGGRYGRERRWRRATALRATDPEGYNHGLADYFPGGSRNRSWWGT